MALQAALRQSITQYRLFLELQAGVAEVVAGGEAEELGKLLAGIEARWQGVQEADEALLPLLAVGGQGGENEPLLRERQALLEASAEQIRRLLPQLEAGMAMVAAELGQVKEGRAAMAGYGAGAETPRGRAVSGRY